MDAADWRAARSRRSTDAAYARVAYTTPIGDTATSVGLFGSDTLSASSPRGCRERAVAGDTRHGDTAMRRPNPTTAGPGQVPRVTVVALPTTRPERAKA